MKRSLTFFLNFFSNKDYFPLYSSGLQLTLIFSKLCFHLTSSLLRKYNYFCLIVTASHTSFFFPLFSLQPMHFFGGVYLYSQSTWCMVTLSFIYIYVLKNKKIKISRVASSSLPCIIDIYMKRQTGY